MRKITSVLLAALLCACLLIPSAAHASAVDTASITESGLRAQGYDAAQTAVILSLAELIEAGKYGVEETIADYTTLTDDQIIDYVEGLVELMTQKSTYERLLEGYGLSATNYKACQDELSSIAESKLQLGAKLNQGSASMGRSAWNELVSQATDLQTRSADLALVITGYDLTRQEVVNLNTQLDAVRSSASDTLLEIAYSRGSVFTQDAMDEITDDLIAIGNVSVELSLIMQETRMAPEPTPVPTPAPTPTPIPYATRAPGMSQAEYDAFLARTAYITEQMNDPDAVCYMLALNESATAHIDIPAGWYEVCYAGDSYMSAVVDTGMVYESGSYPLVNFEWNEESGTLYDVYSYPICPGFSVSVTDCGDGETEFLFLVLTEPIDLAS